MTVASLERCRELNELSGWDGTMFRYDDFTGDWHLCDDVARWPVPEHEQSNVVPAYDLGYLLRRLVPYLNSLSRDEFTDVMERIIGSGDDVEDELAKLAIELFKQGVLKRVAA